jgi:hypothetical protein
MKTLWVVDNARKEKFLFGHSNMDNVHMGWGHGDLTGAKKILNLIFERIEKNNHLKIVMENENFKNYKEIEI